MIDGNSLLNRAFYAMTVFTTSDGLPTNGIFGFIKLLIKIFEDEKPEYLAIAFDVHAPTFRHKMFDGYKGTRRPMPEELVKQVPILKQALQTMGICTVEKEGYEADDLIGTLTCKFPGVEKYVYTGDRDSYQLVKEGVTVCFTRKGVSDLERLTADNFVEKVGLMPHQIIDEKALMGDKSDNIPGVRGIGPKSALELLNEYQTLDNVYAHLEDISAPVRKKLEADRDMAMLSYRLATIDTDVPIDLSLESCRLNLPFPEEARDFFAKLEFRSLLDSPYFPKLKIESYPVVRPTDLEEFTRFLDSVSEFSFCTDGNNNYHFFADGTEYILPLKENILSDGYYQTDLIPHFKKIFSGRAKAIVADLKGVAREFDGIGVEFTCPAEDVMLLRYLSDSNLRPVSVEELAKSYTVSEENVAAAVHRCYTETVKKLEGSKELELYYNLELPLVWVLFDMERTGVRVDENKFPEFSDRFQAMIGELCGQIYKEAGKEFNVNSPVQLSEVLFETLKLKHQGAKRNAKGSFSTGADVLEKLSEEHEIARLILRYREIQKLQSTYIDGFRPLIRNGRVHTTYNQMLTSTGRLSSANPNIQNIPVRREEGRELRKLFVPSEGNVLIDADYSQIELRLLAHYTQSPPLVRAYNSGEDIHAATASLVFGVPLGEVTPELRRRAKAVNFGIIYGISAYGLAKDLNISAAEASGYIDEYFAKYPEVREFMNENVRCAKENGYVMTIFGRKRYIPELKSSNYNMRQFGERAAMNMPLQGSSADIIKIAMIRVYKRLKEEGLKSKLILQVHDELVLDAPVGESEYAKRLLKEEMEGAAQLNVPLAVEVSQGANWYEAK